MIFCFNKVKSISLCLLFVSLRTVCLEFTDITAQGYEQYQDIIINGVLIKPASTSIAHGRPMKHDCESRYNIIKSVLARYQRPFTMLDIGASQGYYSFRTAYEFSDSVCVMIEGNNNAYPLVGTQLEQLCHLNTALDNVILLKKSLILSDLKKLSECEHFDLVLLLNILHWFPAEWRQMADAVLDMGDNIIIETPPQEKVFSQRNYEIEQYILSKGAEVIGTVQRHTTGTPVNLYLIKNQKKSLKRKNWITTQSYPHTIHSTYQEKKQIKIGKYDGQKIVTDWVPGINLITFKMYSGAYPAKEIVKEAAKNTMSTVNNNDCFPNNMVIKGKNIVMIDINDKNFYHGKPVHYSCELSRINAVLSWLDLENPEELSKFFLKTLTLQNQFL